jgi:NAD(P)H-dependent FMN reductase
VNGPYRSYEGAAIAATPSYSHSNTSAWAERLREVLEDMGVHVSPRPVTSASGQNVDQRIELDLTPRQVADLIAALNRS